MSDRKQKVKLMLHSEKQWIKSQPGVIGCSLGIDDKDRDVIRVYIEPARFDEAAEVIKAKLGDLAFPVPSEPYAF